MRQHTTCRFSQYIAVALEHVFVRLLRNWISIV